MNIASWSIDLLRKAVLHSRLQRDYLVGPAQLTHIAQCERLRVDRNGSVLAILRSKNSLALVPTVKLALASEQLQLRLRITDTVGITADDKLMLLLPDTHINGAIHLAGELSCLLVSSIGAIDFEITVYPEQVSAPDSMSERLDLIDQSRYKPIGMSKRCEMLDQHR